MTAVRNQPSMIIRMADDAPVDRRGPRPSTLTRLAETVLGDAGTCEQARLRLAAFGGIQDCYDATVHQLGFDPLAK